MHINLLCNVSEKHVNELIMNELRHLDLSKFRTIFTKTLYFNFILQSTMLIYLGLLRYFQKNLVKLVTTIFFGSLSIATTIK